ncbi:helix-turn-helix domain-containing protein [Actinomadura sp. PM05-2]|uniref:Helix-turn-helix domain-containing protein n=2 Tax=Actinomadura parmotrematis TaxID=2864039 RepID=A0ABS7FYG9_9ACTN|nr:helix-turn-helix domain-containing protein [Actinomadura parmotrematis]
MAVPELDVPAFDAIPGGLARTLRPLVDRAVDDVMAGLPEGGDAWRPGVGRATMVDALGHFCDLIEDSGPAAWAPIAAHYAGLGGRLAHDRRALEQLNRLLLRSARALWQMVDALAAARPADPVPEPVLRLLSEAQFGFLDAASAAVARGRRESGPGEEEHRADLVARLLAGGPDPAELAALADRAGWRVPRRLAAAALRPRPGRDPRRPMLPQGVLADLSGPAPVLLVPDPGGPGRAGLLRPLLADWIVAVGPAVPAHRAASSLRWARETLALAERGVLPDDEVVSGADHLASLVIFQAEELIDHAAATRLAPLGRVAPGHRERLMETLLALLECRFTASEAAAILRVHPQTVRYRLRRLEELFGDALQDPRSCLELEMILRARLAAPRRRAAAAATVAAHG